MDFQEQLSLLRRRVARIDRKYSDNSRGAAPAPVPAAEPDFEATLEPAREERPAHHFIEQLMSGELKQTHAGEHFETERLYERHRRHGSMDISDLWDLPRDLLDALSEGAIRDSHPGRWAFLDTETTGLAGGAGTYAFLIGVGSIDEQGFRVRQFFMRDFGEEASLLTALSEYLARFDVLVTYNGKSYDQPLLETRYRMSRMLTPFERLEHLDLLHGARRLWKLRLDSCRLVDLENQILGVERQGDIPGEMIPYIYFDYLRSKMAFRLVPIFHHNMIDIVSLACLTGIVPFAFRSPESVAVRHGADLVGIARWLVRADRQEQGLALLRRAIELGLPDSLLFRTMWDVAVMEKKLGRSEASLAVLAELSGCRNPFRVQALEELAKHYEHRERNPVMALEMTRAALEVAESPELRKREDRLKKRSQARRAPRLPL